MVTMWDVMRLPCMRGARVVAGQGGLNRRVQAVSVLEYTDPTPMQASLFRNLEITEDELAISAMVSVKDDPDAQCDVIRRLSAYGDSAVSYTLRLWTAGSDYWDVYYDVLEAVGREFSQSNIEMTYPHINVHMDS